MVKNATDFDGKTIVVTGSSGDIGGAIIDSLLGAGATVVGIDHVDVKGFAARDGLSRIRADITIESEVIAAIEEAYGISERLDGLANAAGIEGECQQLADSSADVFSRVLSVNVVGTFLMMKHVVGKFGSEGGAIVNLASVAGLKGVAGLSAYSASKHAVVGLTKSAALEWSSTNIRCNAVCPGPVAGRMIESILSKAAANQVAELQGRAASLPVSRHGEPDEVAALVSFLLSGQASYINGGIYTVDGGASA